ncbi:AraC family transcriptional regulator [Streptomyces cadmiisoli]|uniref:AraC family transcriptional regulator n=1 Tax=Streptomyces cadmiisoli TaxID=2184053 RepID=UPI00364DB645
MSDPLAQVVELLRPRAVFAKSISGAGAWGVRYSEFGEPGFCVVLEGRCLLTVAGHAPITLEQGDFILLPSTPAFTLSGFAPVDPPVRDPKLAPRGTNEAHHPENEDPDVRMLGGNFVFASPDTALLGSLLPDVVHVRDVGRLAVLVQLVREEGLASRPGKELVLTRLVEVLLIEALRNTSGVPAPPGLLRGLADPRLAPVLQQMHERIEQPWTVERLARAAALSRSAFFDRFTRNVGLSPMEYLRAWRMAVAKDLLSRQDLGMAEIAERIGYGSASAFSTAFSRYVGRPPGQYARLPAG